MLPIFSLKVHSLKGRLVAFCGRAQLDFHLIYHLFYFLLYHRVTLLLFLNISLLQEIVCAGCHGSEIL